MGLFGKSGTEKKSFVVEGMTCEHCKRSIEDGLKSLAGISSAKVNLKKKLAQITYDPRQVTLKQVGDKVEELGYKAEMN